MNVIDATALPLFDCFTGPFNKTPFTHLKNKELLDLMNKGTALLKGKEKEYALSSASPQFNRIDGGDDELLNRILWFAAKGSQPYPKHMTIPAKHRKDDDD